ncbi:hypothetical protein PRIPAC_78563 [Pristionchus pacificus]|uniref:Membrane transporter n=1 Tax=Pristionchus pacificus TaxID=54126 RepID=A0A2A6CIY4_PRIPA|nr:hypothetical protein PRIPAC_78563 [Pristionchus pacificus]|eukprot:PDM78194.1 membrane transporter [Pristionchus pacificus]
MSCCVIRRDGDRPVQQSEWRRVIIATVITFLCSVENNMLSVGEWPYMQQIDPEATASFYGAAFSMSKAGHSIFAFAFAYWARKAGMKIPLLAGPAFSLVACVCYLFVEFFPSNRRWWMMFCYFLFGVGYSASVLLRSYIARVSSVENRASAYAVQNGATNVMQAIFVIADDVSLIVAPIYTSQVFAAAGYSTVEIVNGAIYVVATILWIVAWKSLKMFN